MGGRFAPQLSTQCRECPTGYHQDQDAEHVCKQCEAEFYQPFKAQAECTGCPEGYTQTSQGQTYCAGAQAHDSSDSCDVCAIGGATGTFQADIEIYVDCFDHHEVQVPHQPPSGQTLPGALASTTAAAAL